MIQVDSPRGKRAALKLNDLRWHNEARLLFHISKPRCDELPLPLLILLEVPLESVQVLGFKKIIHEKIGKESMITAQLCRKLLLVQWIWCKPYLWNRQDMLRLICFLKWVFFADLCFYSSLDAAVKVKERYCDNRWRDVNHKGLAGRSLNPLNPTLSMTKYTIPVITKLIAMSGVWSAVWNTSCWEFYLWEIKEMACEWHITMMACHGCWKQTHSSLTQSSPAPP